MMCVRISCSWRNFTAYIEHRPSEPPPRLAAQHFAPFPSHVVSHKFHVSLWRRLPSSNTVPDSSRESNLSSVFVPIEKHGVNSVTLTPIAYKTEALNYSSSSAMSTKCRTRTCTLETGHGTRDTSDINQVQEVM
eukprot:scaffold2524_cov86-Skeletonema_dohrnii-CCMP3373.AAC.5